MKRSSYATKFLAVSLIVGLLMPSFHAQAESVKCSAAARTDSNWILEQEIDVADSDAIQALTASQLTSSEATQAVSKWVEDATAKLDQNQKLSVMEHLTFVHLYRSGFLNQLDSVNRPLANRISAALEVNWQRMTDEQKPVEWIVNNSMPPEALQAASDKERAFNDAIFKSEIGASDVGNDQADDSRLKKFAAAAALLSIGIASHHHVQGAELLAGALTGYSVSAMTEYLIHRFRLHASKKTLTFLKERFGERINFAFRFHTGHHHRMFPATKYSTETNVEWNNATPLASNPKLRAIRKNDELAVKQGDSPDVLHENQYGMSMTRYEVFEASVGTITIASVLSYAFGFGAEGFTTAALFAPLTGILTATLHPYLHTPARMACEQAGPVVRMIMSTSYWKMVSRLHFVHHVAQTEANFSLFLPGPDWFFGTLREPDLNAIQRLDEMGIAR